MPQVPLYDQPTVQRQPARGGYQDGNADPGAFGAIQARQLQDVGQALGQASDVAARIEERDDKTSLLDADTKVKEAYTEWATEEGKKVGTAAKGATERAKAWWKETAERVGKDMNPRLQPLLSRALQSQASASISHFASHENQQMEVVAQQTAQSSVSSSIRLAAAIPTDENIAAQKAAIVGALRVYGGNRWDAATMAEKTADAISKLHAGVFNNLFARDPIGAEAYYKANRKEFDPTTYDEIETRLKAGVADVEGAGAARTVIAAATAKLKPTDPMPQAEIDAELVKQLGAKPESLKAARQELDRVAALRDRDISKVEATAVKAVYDAYASGKPLKDLQRMPEWNLMSGDKRVQMTEHINDRNHALWARSIEDRHRRELELERKYAPEVVRLSQPEILANMSRDKIMAMLPQIGYQNVAKLLDRYQSYTSNQVKLGDAKLDNDAFNAALAAAGRDPKPSHNDKDAALFIVNTRNAVEQAVGALQQSKGRELTRQEKDAEIKRVVNSKLMVPGYFGANERSEAALTDEQRKTAFVEVYSGPNNSKTTRVPVSDVPAGEFADTQRFLRESGKPYSTADVVRYWYEFKQRKAK